MINGNYFKSKKILITGASSGIGEALATRLSGYGATLILTGRDAQKLQGVSSRCNKNTCLVVGDLTQEKPLQDLGAVIADLDLAILNAGTNWYMDPSHFSSASFKDLITQNVFTMANCLEVVIPTLIQRKGQLALMGSLAGYGGLSKSAAYGASKAAIRTLAQSLDIDLRPKGVPVTCISPGFVKTPLTDLNTFKMPFLISTDKAVDAILKGLKQKAHEIHFPYAFSLPMKLIMSLPASWQYAIAKRFKETT